MTDTMAQAFADAGGTGEVAITGPQHVLPSTFPVTAVATGVIAAEASAMAAVGARRNDAPARPVEVDTVHAVLACRSERYVVTEAPLAGPADPFAGDHPTADGWIRLHTIYPHLRAAARRVLGLSDDDRPGFIDAVARWPGDELQEMVVDRGGAASVMRTGAGWRDHPHGQHVRSLPLVSVERTHDGPTLHLLPHDRPLNGIRVLDVTRVIAGPTAAKYLGWHGAEVVRVEQPGWPELPVLTIDTGFGKQVLSLDLRQAGDRHAFEELLASSDVFLHGLRPGALEALGYGDEARAALQPTLIDASLSAWGEAGPWAGRRGFDSLVQMAAGIAHDGMVAAGAERPTPLPLQLLDHATAHLLAGGVARAVLGRLEHGGAWRVRASLARTGAWLYHLPRDGDPAVPEPLPEVVDRYRAEANTAWGATSYIRPAGLL